MWRVATVSGTLEWTENELIPEKSVSDVSKS